MPVSLNILSLRFSQVPWNSETLGLKMFTETTTRFTQQCTGTSNFPRKYSYLGLDGDISASVLSLLET